MKKIARVALVQAALLAVTAIGGGFHCSPSASSETPADSPCESTATPQGGRQFVKKHGESTFTASRLVDPVERSIVEQVSVERRGEIVAEYHVRIQEKLLTVEGRYSASVTGVQTVMFQGVPGGKMTGTVNGRAILPFDSAAELHFEDGSTVPSPVVADVDARREIEDLMASLQGSASCGATGVGHSEQAVIKGGVPGNNGLSLECAACGAACVATVSLIATAGFGAPPIAWTV